jgi:hypothetical protein
MSAFWAYGRIWELQRSLLSHLHSIFKFGPWPWYSTFSKIKSILYNQYHDSVFLFKELFWIEETAKYSWFASGVKTYYLQIVTSSDYLRFKIIHWWHYIDPVLIAMWIYWSYLPLITGYLKFPWIHWFINIY